MIRFCLVGLLLVACAQPDVGSQASAITGDPSDRQAIVVVLASTIGSVCSGALVGPRHVLTTKNCVFAGDSPVPPGTVSVAEGSTLSDIDTMGTGAELVMVDETAPSIPLASDTNDYVLVVLTEDFGVTPLSIGTTRPAVDDVLTIAGYGQEATGASGTRREGTIAVNRVMDDFFFTGEGEPNTCQGDGPALDASGALVGIALFSGGSCPPSFTGYRDLIVYRDVVNGWIDSSSTDAGVDPDAGTPDAGEVPDATPGADAGSMGGGGGGCSTTSGSASSLVVLAALLFIRRRRS